MTIQYLSDVYIKIFIEVSTVMSVFDMLNDSFCLAVKNFDRFIVRTRDDKRFIPRDESTNNPFCSIRKK